MAGSIWQPAPLTNWVNISAELQLQQQQLQVEKVSVWVIGWVSERQKYWKYIRRFCPFGPLEGLRYYQWRSKALRGPGSTVTWGPPLRSPPLPPPSIFPCPFPSSPLPLPPLSLLFSSPAPPRLPLPQSGPQIQLGAWGSALNSPAGSGAEPQPKLNLVHFTFKIRHLVATILMIFLRVLPKIILWPHYSGPQELGGPVHWTAWTPGSYATRSFPGHLLRAYRAFY